MEEWVNQTANLANLNHETQWDGAVIYTIVCSNLSKWPYFFGVSFHVSYYPTCELFTLYCGPAIQSVTVVLQENGMYLYSWTLRAINRSPFAAPSTSSAAPVIWAVDSGARSCASSRDLEALHVDDSPACSQPNMLSEWFCFPVLIARAHVHAAQRFG